MLPSFFKGDWGWAWTSVTNWFSGMLGSGEDVAEALEAETKAVGTQMTWITGFFKWLKMPKIFWGKDKEDTKKTRWKDKTTKTA